MTFQLHLNKTALGLKLGSKQQKTTQLFKRALPVCLLTSILAGCAIPGMRMNLDHLTPTVNAQNKIVTPHLIPITAQLVQKQNQSTEISSALASKNYLSPKGFSTQTNLFSYHLGPQDVVRITVWNQAELNTAQMSAGNLSQMGQANNSSLSGAASVTGISQGAQLLTLDNHGNIFYPFVGVIHLGGLTLDQARQLLTHKLSAFIRNPQISVSVAAFNSQKVEVTGAVKKSAVIPITNVPLTILNAITDAGGPVICGASSTGNTQGGATSLCADLQNVTLTRNGKTIFVNLNKLEAPNGSSENWILQSGDVIHVPNNNLYRIFVMGAVLVPGPYNMVDGQMTLKEAIGDARGFTIGSAPKYTYIIRNYKHHPEIYSLDLQSPDALSLAGDFALRPEDVVFVSTSPLETFNNLLGQITPSLQTAVYTKSLLN